VINLPTPRFCPGDDAHTHLTFDLTLAIRTGHFYSKRSLRRQECTDHAGSRLHHRAQRGPVANRYSLRDAINEGMSRAAHHGSGRRFSITADTGPELLPMNGTQNYCAARRGRRAAQSARDHQYGADVIKVAPQRVLPRAMILALRNIRWKKGSHCGGRASPWRKVAAHAHGAQGIAWAAEAGVDPLSTALTLTMRNCPDEEERTYWFPRNIERLDA